MGSRDDPTPVEQRARALDLLEAVLDNLDLDEPGPLDVGRRLLAQHARHVLLFVDPVNKVAALAVTDDGARRQGGAHICCRGFLIEKVKSKTHNPSGGYKTISALRVFSYYSICTIY